MQFQADRPKRPRENIVPLINVVFLLLIFFMLAGTLRSPDLDVRLPEQRLETEAPPADGRKLTVDASGELSLDGIGLTGAELQTTLAGAPADRLFVRADARLPARKLLPLLASLREAGVAELLLVTSSAP